jgi:hypothetical protein
MKWFVIGLVFSIASAIGIGIFHFNKPPAVVYIDPCKNMKVEYASDRVAICHNNMNLSGRILSRPRKPFTPSFMKPNQQGAISWEKQNVDRKSKKQLANTNTKNQRNNHADQLAKR